MKTIVANKKKPTLVKPGDYPRGPTGTLIESDTEFRDETGRLICSYFRAPSEIVKIARVVALNTKPAKPSRTRVGVPQLSTVYGVIPRNPIREDYCRFTKKTNEERANANLAFQLNCLVAGLYKQMYPREYNLALTNTMENIDSSYRVVDTPWTNVNVNLNQVIKYHYDKGNNPKDLSNVLIVKNKCSGGYLDCPELGVTLAQNDGYMVFFLGQEILHGVTPCNMAGNGSYRCSLVFYTLNGMKNCYPYEQELARLRKQKTKQARNRLNKLAELRGILGKNREKMKPNP